MKSNVRYLHPATSDASHATGTVLEIEGPSYVVDTDAGRLACTRATGCLVAPEVGDLVLLAIADRGVFLLTVLDREDSTSTRVAVEGDLRLELRSGKLGLSASEGVDIASGAPVTMVAPELNVAARQGEIAVERMAFLGGAVEVDVGKVKLVASTVDQIVDRFTQRLKRAARFVEQLDQLRAGSIDYVAEKLLELHGENAAVTAQQLVKVDGAQIHVG